MVVYPQSEALFHVDMTKNYSIMTLKSDRAGQCDHVRVVFLGNEKAAGSPHCSLPVPKVSLQTVKESTPYEGR